MVSGHEKKIFLQISVGIGQRVFSVNLEGSAISYVLIKKLNFHKNSFYVIEQTVDFYVWINDKTICDNQTGQKINRGFYYSLLLCGN